MLPAKGNDFVISNGNRRFIRALVDTNSAFRAEAGDLPEFALYMPGTEKEPKGSQPVTYTREPDF